MKTLGNYQLLAELGKGGMGNVYLALHKGIGGFEKKVAIKCILPHVADDAEFIRMLVDEARLTVQLTHPNIVQIIDLASEGELHYVVMEYVEGVDLHSLAERADPPLALDESAHIIAEAAHALAYAHRKCGADGKPMDIVHRDISAHNLLVTAEGNTKVLDFGIAKAASNRVTTQIGVLKGKLAYMSPEQALGKGLDGRSDLFSLGIVMWELVTGQRLFSGHTDIQTLLKVQKCEVEAPSRLITGFPRDLEEIVLRCLARDPADRYADGDRLADDLHEFMRSHQGAVHPRVRLAKRVADLVAAHPPRPLAGSAASAPAEQTLMNAAAHTMQLPRASISAEIPEPRQKRVPMRRIVTAAAATTLGLAFLGSLVLAQRSPSPENGPAAVAAASLPQWIPDAPAPAAQEPDPRTATHQAELPQQTQAESSPPVETSPQAEPSPRVESNPHVNLSPRADLNPRADSNPRMEASPHVEASSRVETSPQVDSGPQVASGPRVDSGPRVEPSPHVQASARAKRPAPANAPPQSTPAPQPAAKVAAARAAPKSTAKPSPAPAKSAPAESGFLSLNAVPWARVYIDGKSVADSTPLLRYALAPGSYTVVVVNPDLKARKELKIEIQSGEHLRRSINLP